jgi:hypothetical protein
MLFYKIFSLSYKFQVTIQPAIYELILKPPVFSNFFMKYLASRPSLPAEAIIG